MSSLEFAVSFHLHLKRSAKKASKRLSAARYAAKALKEIYSRATISLLLSSIIVIHSATTHKHQLSDLTRHMEKALQLFCPIW